MLMSINQTMAKIKLLTQGLEYIKVSEQALEDYRNFVKDKKGENIVISLIKINRNFQCSLVTHSTKYYITKQYGNLDIRYNKEKNIITSIKNINYSEITYKGARPFNIDWDCKKKFDAVLGKKKFDIILGRRMA